jgi:hypothetical protein
MIDQHVEKGGQARRGCPIWAAFSHPLGSSPRFSTYVGIFLTPVFFYVIRRISRPKSLAVQPAHEAHPDPH